MSLVIIPSMCFSTIFFDLDDTIYPHSTGIWDEIRERMDIYMHDRLKLPLDEIPKLRMSYLETYGTTLRGLQNQMQIDTQDFLEFVHDVPVNKYLKFNEPLKKILLSRTMEP